ncbi:MAG TPA: hypothetical protein PKY59_22475 [Pyrinomonadaceae bacterium]|nr:hypothetical protein [Pyrinomonadaceae bacterium]
MKIDMSPKAIENRLKLVGELTKACLLIGKSSSEILKKTPEINASKDFLPQLWKNDLKINK